MTEKEKLAVLSKFNTDFYMENINNVMYIYAIYIKAAYNFTNMLWEKNVFLSIVFQNKLKSKFFEAKISSPLKLNPRKQHPW